MIPLLRRSTKIKKKRTVVVFNFSSTQLNPTQLNPDSDGPTLIVNLEQSENDFLNIGRAYVCTLISDFVLFDDTDKNIDPFFKGLMMGFCDNQNKLTGSIVGDNEIVNHNNEIVNLYSMTFKSRSLGLQWVKDNIVPKKLKLNPGGNLYEKSIRKYMTEFLDKDEVIKKIYFNYGHVRKMIDNIPLR